MSSHWSELDELRKKKMADQTTQLDFVLSCDLTGNVEQRPHVLVQENDGMPCWQWEVAVHCWHAARLLAGTAHSDEVDVAATHFHHHSWNSWKRVSFFFSYSTNPMDLSCKQATEAEDNAAVCVLLAFLVYQKWQQHLAPESNSMPIASHGD